MDKSLSCNEPYKNGVSTIFPVLQVKEWNF